MKCPICNVELPVKGILTECLPEHGCRLVNKGSSIRKPRLFLDGEPYVRDERTNQEIIEAENKLAEEHYGTF